MLHWVKRSEIDSGMCDGMTASKRERIKALEHENKELRRANEILKSASAFLVKLHIRLLSPRRRSTAN